MRHQELQERKGPRKRELGNEDKAGGRKWRRIERKRKGRMKVKGEGDARRNQEKDIKQKRKEAKEREGERRTEKMN